MKAKILFIILCTSFILINIAQAKPEEKEALTLLDEVFLKESLKENPPSIDRINANLFGAEAREKSLDDNFNTNLSASANYYDTKEKQFATFIPVTSPTSNFDVTISRSFAPGVTVGVRGFSEKFSNNFVKDASTTGVSVQLGFNIWKDLFAGMTKSELEKARANTEQIKWQSDIAKKSFLNTLRKVYWSIVANEEALKVTSSLLDSSKKQVVEAKRRFRNKIADEGELARYQSQVASRQASIVSLRYEKASLVQTLKELIPHISLNRVELKPYNIDNTITRVLACTSVIASNSSPPMDFTYYDEIVDLVDRQSKLETKVNNAYDDIDVKLQTEYGYKGRDNSRSDSLSNLSEDGRRNYGVGLTLSIPLENKKKTTREILNKTTQLKYRSKKKEELGKVKAYHTQTVRQISLLREIIRNQKANTSFLKKSLKSSKRKYNQARLNVQQLVQEQDAYLNSNLDEIRTKLAVINTIFDYLSVYTETPCELNNL